MTCSAFSRAADAQGRLIPAVVPIFSVTVLARVQLTLDRDEFLLSLGESAGRPAMREAAIRALGDAEQLVHPALVYDWFPVGAREARRVQVGGVVFELGRHADLLRPARSAFLAAVTIGPALEIRSRELQAYGKALDSFMLDAAGVFTVGKLLETARSLVERESSERGWGVGAELAPGQLSGWAIAEQKLVGRLLDLGSIGVSITDSGMLVPQKSATLMVGAGPDYTSALVRSPCEYCDVSDTCRYRH